jgi:hypothetical protein
MCGEKSAQQGDEDKRCREDGDGDVDIVEEEEGKNECRKRSESCQRCQRCGKKYSEE